ncbi:hypothetical protein [Spirosoma utsteinense]|uniref:Uncharacterized protein n=1 Tax=Spirosoma utsteinense TaxID=2585773 RepID=A0ABR6WB05_9BACT|nr:hypothetical protein [Spirosoma utsteinense]MBC3787340.1 hypothetical protein [Spirosoma utsteinense]MBC3793106.1 hypothetical protein [Spirosoma utsteinense]
MTQLPKQADLESTDMFVPVQETTPSSPKPALITNKKKMLGISAATVLLGGAVGLAIANNVGEGEETLPSGTANLPSPTEIETGRLPQDIDVAGKVTDDMSFEQAFKAARDEVGEVGVFNWHGLWYNTFEKEEWSELSLEQRQEFVEAVTGEKLPVKLYSPQQTTHDTTSKIQEQQLEPTIIEGYLNGQRVMGLDFNQDGVIDTLVMDGQDGSTYRVVDATGDDGLDTVYRYDSLNGDLTGVVGLGQPFVLSNDDFSQQLENSMSQEVIDSILEPETTVASPILMADLPTEAPEEDPDEYVASSSEPDDTYINNGDVHDMED